MGPIAFGILCGGYIAFILLLNNQLGIEAEWCILGSFFGGVGIALYAILNKL